MGKKDSEKNKGEAAKKKDRKSSKVLENAGREGKINDEKGWVEGV